MEYHPVNNTSNGTTETKKVEEYPPPTVHPCVIPPVRKNVQFLTEQQLKQYDETGILIIPSDQMWTPQEMKLLLASVNMMNDWQDAPGKYMKYYEKKRSPDGTVLTPEEKILCRIENFTQYNPGLDYVLAHPKLVGMATELFGEQAILYKEKINYKLPGGDGFAPHQDVAAGWWMYGQTLHLSCLVCIDPATVENGCLEVVRAAHLGGMMSEDWHELPESVYTKLKFEHVPTQPGDVLFFDSYVPHRSAPNNTDKSRRLLYLTYAKAAEGDWRERYYADKRASYPPDCEREPGKVYQYKV